MRRFGSCLASIVAVAMASAGLSSGDEAIAGKVPRGAAGNQVSVSVSNPSETMPAQQLSVAIVSTPDWMENISLEADGDGELEAGARRTFTFSFDVGADADVGAVGELVVSFETSGALIDTPLVSVLLEVAANPDEKPEIECTVDHEHAIPDWNGAEKHDVYVFRDEQSTEVLRLLVYSGPREATFEIALQSSHDEKLGPFLELSQAMEKAEEYCEGSGEGDDSPGAAPVLRLAKVSVNGVEGTAAGAELMLSGSFDQSSFDELLSGGFNAVPKTIVAGQEISFSGTAMRSVRYADGSICFPGEPEPDAHVVRLSMNAGLRTEAHGTVGMYNYCRGNVKRSVSWNTGSRTYSGINVFTDASSVSVSLTPIETIIDADDPNIVDFRYRTSVSGLPVLVESTGSREAILIRQRYRTDDRGHAVSEVSTGSTFVVSLSVPSMTNGNGIGVTLVYEPMVEGSAPVEVVPHEHPEPFPPTTGDGDIDGTTVDPGDSDGTPGPPDDGSEDDGGTGTVGTESDDGPRMIDPKSPGITALIAQWVAVAEPPENATAGADLRYNDWGQMVGSTPSGTITAVGRPDDVGARSSPEYLWGLKGRLDSVDHCTLGEYVEGRVAGSAPTGCVGRYMGEVQALQGRSEGSARAKIEELKWVAVVMKGDPAPTAELAGTVQRQDPAPTTRLPRGKVVQLWLYEEAMQTQVEVPDLAGQSSRMAGAWLDEIGLVAVVQPGGPAPTADLVGKVESQDPRPGSGLAEGDAVVVRVYADPVAVPSPASVDCSRWPGSVPTTHPTSGELVCDCPTGLRWNRSGTGCETVGDSDQTVCDRDWPGTIARRNPSSGQLECECPSGLAWDDRSRSCVENVAVGVVPILPDQPSGCAHMPGTIAVRDPRSGRTECRCSVGVWNAAQNRCVTAALPPLEPRVCIGYYGDIRFAGVTGDPAAAARAESAARAAGCSPEHIAEAVSSGTSWGDVSRTVTGGTTGHRGGGDDDSPITPITEPAPDKDEGDANVSTRFVKICIVDVNSVLDDHYHLLVNNRYIGDVANPEGGTTCYNATLNGGSNRLELRLYATRGKNTKLEMSLNNGEYSAIFTGENNHIWNVVAP